MNDNRRTNHNGDRCIYALIDPRPGVRIAYVGQSYDPIARFCQHWAQAAMAGRWGRPARVQLWLAELLWYEYGFPTIEVLEFVPGPEADAAERRWRASYRTDGWELMNSEGMMSAASRAVGAAKISAALRGRKWTPQQRAAASLRTVSPETRAKISASHLARRGGNA